MNYKFKFSRGLFWHSVLVAGHRYDQALDKMVLYFPDGGLREIPVWSKYGLKLGVDWVLAMKKTMEAQAGQAIPVKGV